MDGEIVNHRLHRERQRMLQLFARSAHRFAKELLRLGLPVRSKDEPHPPTAHTAQHPEALKIRGDMLAYFADKGFGIKVASRW
jgi:hypothetical protein